MNEGRFSFYKSPQEPFRDSRGGEHLAQLSPKETLNAEQLFRYITTDKEARRVTEQFRDLLKSEQASETVPRFHTEKGEDGKRIFVEDGTTDKKRAFKNRMFRFITATGTFTYKSAKYFKTPSNLVCVDFDHFCDSEEEVRKAKEALLDSRLLCTPLLIFTSPSGDGLKCLYEFEHVEDEEERLARLKGLYKYLRFSFPSWKDKSKPGAHALDEVLDLARGCNIPFDPEAVLNKDGHTSLKWSEWKVLPKPYTPTGYTPEGDLEAKVQYYANSLVQRGLDITDGMTFGDYLGLAYSLKSLSHGKEIFLQVSSLWAKYTENNSLKAWAYADKQAPRTDVTYFISLARQAGVPSWESSTDEGKAQAREYMKQQDAGKQQARKQATQGTNKTTMEKDQAPGEQDPKKERIKDLLTVEELEAIVFNKNSFEDVMNKAGDVPASIPTKYKFNGNTLTLKASALTIFGAQTSHGKTRFLENVLLDTCDPQEGVTLFFTLEEIYADVLAELVNVYARTPNLCDKYQNNFDTLQAVFRRLKTKEPEAFPYEDPVTLKGGKTETRFNYLRQVVNHFYEEYLQFGNSLKILDDERLREVDVLFRACKMIAEQGKVRAVFIDHVGMIYEKDVSPSLMKTERVERIFTKLELLAKELACPVVLSQQLNRPSEGALSMNNTNLSDSADSERSANTIVLLWNSQDIPTKTKEADVQDLTTPKALLERGFEYGTPGTIFARLSKRRGGQGKNSFSVFNFDGDTGVIQELTDKELKEKQEKFKPANKNILHPPLESNGTAKTSKSKTSPAPVKVQELKTEAERQAERERDELPF